MGIFQAPDGSPGTFQHQLDLWVLFPAPVGSPGTFPTSVGSLGFFPSTSWISGFLAKRKKKNSKAIKNKKSHYGISIQYISEELNNYFWIWSHYWISRYFPSSSWISGYFPSTSWISGYFSAPVGSLGSLPKKEFKGYFFQKNFTLGFKFSVYF